MAVVFFMVSYCLFGFFAYAH
ncbi:MULTISPECIES: hypothetical protein [unclassified Aureispira]